MMSQRFSANATAGNAKERTISVRGNNTSRSIRRCNYGLYFQTIVIKCAKQTTVKWQENTASPKANVWRWKLIVTGTHQFYAKIVICMNSKTKQNVSCVQRYSTRGSNLSQPKHGVYKWCREQVFFLLKVFVMQEVIITFQCTINEMLPYFNLASNYIINDVGAASAVENVRQCD
jgi:hypothetical protein